MSVPNTEASSSRQSGGRIRVAQACDRCRVKKSKCDGEVPCNRCRAENGICVFGARKVRAKTYPRGYVEVLESQQTQLIAGLQAMYQRMELGEGWIGTPLERTSNGMPLVHDILDRLGVLDQGGHALDDSFEEDFNALRQRFLADSPELGPSQPSISELRIPRSNSEPLRPFGTLLTMSPSPTQAFQPDPRYQDISLRNAISAPDTGYPTHTHTPEPQFITHTPEPQFIPHRDPPESQFDQPGYFIDPSTLDGAIELSYLSAWPPHTEGG